MGKTGQIICEMHLYDNKIEALIKVVVWIISWIGGISVLLNAENKEVLGSAYFIYTLSLLMEFVPKIYDKKKFLSKLIHTILCFIMTIVCVLSVGILFGVSLPEIGYQTMLIMTIVIIAYMVIDIFILWIEPVDSSVTDKYNNTAEFSDSQETFSDRLLGGNLGKINGGANNG